jgi:hypothetical protein
LDFCHGLLGAAPTGAHSLFAPWGATTIGGMRAGQSVELQRVCTTAGDALSSPSP